MRHLVIPAVLTALDCDPGLMAYAPPEAPRWDSQSPYVTILDGPNAGGPAPVGLEGTVDTEYEDTSFIVYESTDEGWTRWRTTDRGPLVWYYTRGC